MLCLTSFRENVWKNNLLLISGERKERDDKYRKEGKRPETEEERKIRKEKERKEREDRAKKEGMYVVYLVIVQ